MWAVGMVFAELIGEQGSRLWCNRSAPIYPIYPVFIFAPSLPPFFPITLRSLPYHLHGHHGHGHSYSGLSPLVPGANSLPSHLPSLCLPWPGLSPLVPGENDIDQLSKMTQTLGDIESRWPHVSETPDWGKVTFPSCPGRPLTELLPGASSGALDLLEKLLR